MSQRHRVRHPSEYAPSRWRPPDTIPISRHRLTSIPIDTSFAISTRIYSRPVAANWVLPGARVSCICYMILIVLAAFPSVECPVWARLAFPADEFIESWLCRSRSIRQHLPPLGMNTCSLILSIFVFWILCHWLRFTIGNRKTPTRARHLTTVSNVATASPVCRVHAVRVFPKILQEPQELFVMT